MPSIALQNLGCSKNLIDGEKVLNLFYSAGFRPAQELNDADIIIVNTCAFIREAQEEAIGCILESAAFKKNGRCKTLVVAGCFSQRYRKDAAVQFPEVNVWAGVDDWEEVFSQYFGISSRASFKRELSQPVASQYIKIAEGCSHRCSFCVIPSIRGNFRSRQPEAIIEEANWLYEQGVRELIVVAQDSSFYGRDINSSLTMLLELLLQKTLFPWFRLMYLHPGHINEELLQLMASQTRICSYFDIPLQHISEPILRAMNRTPLTKDTYRLIEQIRTTVPGAALRSSFILGFPGETEKHFKELQRFIEFARFEKLGVFPFSPEEGTSASSMKPRPRSSTAAKRCEELMLQQREISREILETKIGTCLEVIIDGISENPDFNFEARSRYDAPEIDGKVLIVNGNFDPGSFTRVKIIGSSDYDLFAEA